MKIPIVIIINGPAAAGKTTIGRAIAEKLRLPFICKDDFKELLFDNLGWSDAAWSKRLGKASFEILWHVVGVLVRAGNSMIIETKFDPKAAVDKFSKLKKDNNFKVFELNFHASREVLLERFKLRAATVRHPGHVDLTRAEEYAANLNNGRIDHLNLPGITIIDIDTTDFEKVDIDQIVLEIKKAVKMVREKI